MLRVTRCLWLAWYFCSCSGLSLSNIIFLTWKTWNKYHITCKNQACYLYLIIIFGTFCVFRPTIQVIYTHIIPCPVVLWSEFRVGWEINKGCFKKTKIQHKDAVPEKDMPLTYLLIVGVWTFSWSTPGQASRWLGCIRLGCAKLVWGTKCVLRT